MGWISGIAIYFIIWWTVLFAVLPWKIKQQKKVIKGNDPGAPENPMIKEKALATTILSAIIWLIIFGLIEFNIISLDMVRG